MRRIGFIAVTIGFLVFGSVGYLAGSAHLLRPSSLAAASDCQMFPATGFQACGDFLNYWNSHGGLAQQGYPISAPFQEKSETDGITRTVQYFERAVFEAHPENQPPNNVLLSLLGSQKYKAKYPNGAPSGGPPTSTVAAAPTREPTTTTGSLALLASGYGQRRTEVGYGFVVMNTDAANELDDSQYQIAAYDASGAVLKTDSGRISTLLPNQRIGIAGSLYLSDGVTPARVAFQLSAGTKKPHDPATFPLTASNLTFQPDPYFPKVTGTVSNAGTTDAKQVFLYVIAYDAGGKIIGSGLGLLDFIPAKGQAAAEAGIIASGTPTRFEMYPTYL